MEDFDKFEEGEEVDYDFNLDDDLLDEGPEEQEVPKSTPTTEGKTVLEPPKPRIDLPKPPPRAPPPQPVSKKHKLTGLEGVQVAASPAPVAHQPPTKEQLEALELRKKQEEARQERQRIPFPASGQFKRSGSGGSRGNGRSAGLGRVPARGRGLLNGRALTNGRGQSATAGRGDSQRGGRNGRGTMSRGRAPSQGRGPQPGRMVGRRPVNGVPLPGPPGPPQPPRGRMQINGIMPIPSRFPSGPGPRMPLNPAAVPFLPMPPDLPMPFDGPGPGLGLPPQFDLRNGGHDRGSKNNISRGSLLPRGNELDRGSRLDRPGLAGRERSRGENMAWRGIGMPPQLVGDFDAGEEFEAPKRQSPPDFRGVNTLRDRSGLALPDVARFRDAQPPRPERPPPETETERKERERREAEAERRAAIQRRIDTQKEENALLARLRELERAVELNKLKESIARLEQEQQKRSAALTQKTSPAPVVEKSAPAPAPAPAPKEQPATARRVEAPTLEGGSSQNKRKSLGDGRDDMESDRALKRARSPPTSASKHRSRQMAEPESSRGSRMRSSSRPEANTRRHEDLEAERHGGDLRDYLEQKKQRVRRPEPEADYRRGGKWGR